MRLKFWIWAHGCAENLWHWIYYKRMLPLGYGGPPFSNISQMGGNYSYSISFVGGAGEIKAASNPEGK